MPRPNLIVCRLASSYSELRTVRLDVDAEPVSALTSTEPVVKLQVPAGDRVLDLRLAGDAPQVEIVHVADTGVTLVWLMADPSLSPGQMIARLRGRQPGLLVTSGNAVDEEAAYAEMRDSLDDRPLWWSALSWRWFYPLLAVVFYLAFGDWRVGAVFGVFAVVEAGRLIVRRRRVRSIVLAEVPVEQVAARSDPPVG